MSKCGKVTQAPIADIPMTPETGEDCVEIKLLDAHTTWRSEEYLYDLMRERSEEADSHINISHRTLPSWEEHLTFMARRPYYRWWLIFRGTDFAGSLSITNRNEIGIVLKQAFRGMGIGRHALQMLLDTARPLPAVPSQRHGCFVANINPLNEASIHLFTRLGAVHIQNTYAFEERENAKKESRPTDSTSAHHPAG